MKLIIVVLALVAAVAAAPAEVSLPVPVKIIEILRSDYDQKPEGSYSFSYETENGIKRVETAEVKEVVDEEKKPHIILLIRGSYSFPKEDGSLETVNYWADDSGYHAEGPSIPKSESSR